MTSIAGSFDVTFTPAANEYEAGTWAYSPDPPTASVGFDGGGDYSITYLLQDVGWVFTAVSFTDVNQQTKGFVTWNPGEGTKFRSWLFPFGTLSISTFQADEIVLDIDYDNIFDGTLGVILTVSRTNPEGVLLNQSSRDPQIVLQPGG